MNVPGNPQVYAWISSGHLKEALVGEGKYFIPDVTYRDQHSITLVVHTLFACVELEDNGHHFVQLLDEALRELSIERPEIALTSLWSVIRQCHSHRSLYDAFSFDETLKRVISRITPEMFSKVTLGATLEEYIGCVKNELASLKLT